MIKITPPQSLPFIPSTQEIAYLNAQLYPRPNGTVIFSCQLLDANRRPITPDPSVWAAKQPSQADVAAWCAGPAPEALDSFFQDIFRRCLPFAAKLGLTGATVE